MKESRSGSFVSFVAEKNKKEVTMTQKKLFLNKITVWNFDSVLDRDEQKKVKGGSDDLTRGTTNKPIYC
jgi:hypothetical protein